MDRKRLGQIGAAIGTFALAMVTYLTLREMQKGRLFELKKMVYFELLDILSKAINKWRNIELDEELEIKGSIPGYYGHFKF